MSTDRVIDAAAPGGAALQPFAAAMRAAVEASELGLERIQQLLRQRGTNVSVATLSYWQSGRRVPGRRTSFVALAHLEDVLGVPPGSLARHIPPRGSEARAVNSVATFAAAMGDGVEVPELIAALDARLRRQFEMVSEHAVVTIGADRTHQSRWTRRVMRAIADGVDRLLLADLVDDDVPPPKIEPLAHCTLGQRHLLETSRFVISELLFDRVLDEGDSMMIEYRHEYGPPYPYDTAQEIHKQMPMRAFVMEVRFHPDAVPARCEWYEYASRSSDAIAKVQPLVPSRSGSVLIVRHDLRPSRFGLRWFWD